MRNYVRDLLSDSECILETGQSTIFVLNWERQEFRELLNIYKDFDSDWSKNQSLYGDYDSSQYLTPSELKEVWSEIKSKGLPVFSGEIATGGLSVIKTTEAQVIDAINVYHSKIGDRKCSDKIKKLFESESDTVAIIVEDFYQGHMPYALFRLIDFCKKDLEFTDDDLYCFFLLAAKKGYLFRTKQLFRLSNKFKARLMYERDPRIRMNEDYLRIADYCKEEIEEIYGITFLNEKSYRSFGELRLMKMDDVVNQICTLTEEKLMKSSFSMLLQWDYSSGVYFDLSNTISNVERCEQVANSACLAYGITRTNTFGNFLRYLNFRSHAEPKGEIKAISGLGNKRRILLLKAFESIGIEVPYITCLAGDK